MPTKTIKTQPYFSAQLKGGELKLSFRNKASADTFARMDFYSRLLHSLKPSDDGVWREGPRLNVEIIGWPKEYNWVRTAEREFVCKRKDWTDTTVKEYTQILGVATQGIMEGKPSPNGKAFYSFMIGKGNDWKPYLFYSKARTIGALCVLYDLEQHPRNHLEINIPAKHVANLEWPKSDHSPDHIVRYYGDPSKTADVLRNEGWSREGPNATMVVSRQHILGSQQQSYKITTPVQTTIQQVMRTNIPGRWRRELFKLHDYTCQICHNKYTGEYLAPDHRVPVVFQADELNDDNFKTKLMTLCRFCNQQKREFCKRIPHDYSWNTSPWAYPEKFELKKIGQEIKDYATTYNLTFEKVVELLEKQ